ncbi:DEAD/DEAH box helicase [Actinospongicola halichondriae]|uniref:DEAD/DEAH box helicase n=1 Tax=Actinospongicola halichondriae TaxID=3236844 RepID=UPI003D55E05A
MATDPGVELEALVRRRDDRLSARDEAHLADPRRLVHMHRIPATEPRYGTLAEPLPEAVADRFPVDRLYAHQAAALDLVRAGTSVAVATSTSSGKSLIYQAAIAEAASRPVRPGTALCIYPTKALAHDQHRSFVDLALPGVITSSYDGDAGRDERADARRNATVLLTNPEMLHCGLLPHHAGWMRFLSRLEYVVIDELHLFRGIFGSHVSHVIRRLRRLAAHYGADPTFVCTSATVGRPAELAAEITGVPVTAVTDDGSPSGARSVAVWNPPVLDAETGMRASSHTEAAGLVADLVRDGRRTLGFCPSRRTTELVAERTRRQVPADSRSRVAAYRGGFLAEERHEIEQALVEGTVDAVLATSALELGVDFDGVDACVLDGFPGTVASMWQRIGRAGRQRQDSLAVLVCGSDQLDQWAAAHPAELFDRPPEPAVVNHANPYVADPHLRCAAFELPLTHDDERFWPGLLDDSVRRLVADDELIVRPPGGGTAGGRGRRRRLSPTSPVAVWAGNGWPVDRVGLRSGSPGQVKIVRPDGTPVGTVDKGRAGEVVHEGAVYLHAGRHYRVRELDLDGGRAVVEPDDGGTYTAATTRMDLRIRGEDRVDTSGPVRLAVGPIEVTTRVTGYVRKDAMSGEVVERNGLSLPPARLETRGVWRVIPEDLLAGAGLVPESWPGVLHAAEHAAIGVLPLFAICDRWDVGGISTAKHVDTGAPTIVIYDGYPGGAGIAELGFEAAERHWQVTAEVIAACPCSTGCPSCVQSPKCGNGNEPLDKAGALAMLAALTGVEVPDIRRASA